MADRYWDPKLALSRRSFARWASLGALGAGALAVAGCGDDDKEPAKGTPSATTAAGSTPAVASASAAVSAAARPDLSKMSEKEFFEWLPDMPAKDFEDKDIKGGGKFTRLFNRQPNLDFVTQTNPGPVAEVVAPVYSRLLRFNSNAGLKSSGDLVLEGDLGQKWERPDNLTLVITLAPGIKWQNVPPTNGRAFAADDVKYSFERGRTFAKSAFKVFYDQFTAVEAVANNQVRLKLKEPNPAAEPLLASLFMNIMSRELGENAEQASLTAVGTGPFIIEKNTPNVEYVLRKNPDYFKKDALGRQLPYVDGYTLPFIADPATQTALLEKGEVAGAYLGAQPLSLDTIYPFAKRNPNMMYQGTVATYSGYTMVGHHNQAPWSDPRVRQAVNLLMDRKTVIDQLFKGKAYVGPYHMWPWVMDKRPGLDDLGQWYKYDVAKAKQLLAAAGHEKGLEFDLHYFESPVIPEPMLILVQQSLAQGGVKLNLVKSEQAAHAAKQNAKNWSGLLAAGRAIDFPDAMASMPAYLPGTGTNFGDVNDAKWVEMYEKQRSLLGNERKAVLKQAWDHLLDQIYDIALPSALSLMVWQPFFKNFRIVSPISSHAGLGNGSFDQVWLSKA